MNVDELYLKAGKLSAEGRYEEAISYFNEAIKLKPYFGIFYSRGFAYLQLGQYQRAIQDFDETLSLKPQYVAALYDRACAYSLMNSESKAIDSLRQAIALDPNCRMAKNDVRFDNIRHQPEFKELVKGSDNLQMIG